MNVMETLLRYQVSRTKEGLGKKVPGLRKEIMDAMDFQQLPVTWAVRKITWQAP
jgi:hypothetical protein